MALLFESFATLRISVLNVRVSRDWYSRFFGVPPVEDLPGFVSFRVGGVLFDISTADMKSPLSTAGSVGYWLVDDLDSAVEFAVGLGASVYRGPLVVPEVGRRIVQILDPFGNVFGLEGRL